MFAMTKSALDDFLFTSLVDLPEWGKRYLQPVAEWFGFEFPDTITNVSFRSRGYSALSELTSCKAAASLIIALQRTVSGAEASLLLTLQASDESPAFFKRLCPAL